MTITEAVELARRLENTDIPTETLTGWLSDLDQQIFSEVIRKHDAFLQEGLFPTYDPGTSLNQDLLVEDGYAGDVYPNYLAARINQANGDMERYANAAALFNTALSAWKNHYTETHLPVSRGRFRF